MKKDKKIFIIVNECTEDGHSWFNDITAYENEELAVKAFGKLKEQVKKHAEDKGRTFEDQKYFTCSYIKGKFVEDNWRVTLIETNINKQ